MDRGTLLAHRALWVKEATPTRRELSRLDPDEAALYDDQRYDGLAPHYAWNESASASAGSWRPSPQSTAPRRHND